MMHLIVTKISYKESCQDPVKVYQIVAAATFYINKKNATFLVYVGTDRGEISLSSFGLSSSPPSIYITKHCLGTFLVSCIQKISLFINQNYEMCLQANDETSGPKMFYQKLMFERIPSSHTIVACFKNEIKQIVQLHRELTCY